MVQNGRRWIEASDLMPMFPAFVSNIQIQIESGLRDALRATILAALAETRVRLAPLVPGDGWQSGQALHQNADQVVIKAHDGTLLIFPSYLEHSVDTNTNDEERISISFNVMSSSFTERLSKPLWSAHNPLRGDS